jgi:GTPase SAR1 family protein
MQLDILNTAGQDDFAPMRTSHMRQGKGFIIVYAI